MPDNWYLACHTNFGIIALVNNCLSSIKPAYDVIVSPFADFVIGEYTFEVGGKNKGLKQV